MTKRMTPNEILASFDIDLISLVLNRYPGLVDRPMRGRTVSG